MEFYIRECYLQHNNSEQRKKASMECHKNALQLRSPFFCLPHVGIAVFKGGVGVVCLSLGWTT